jgi:hypothetical protein
MTISAQQEQQLLEGGECYLHYHPEDRVPTHDTLNRLQNLANEVTISASYTATYNDDHIICSAACTVTLPPARAGKEIEVTQTFVGTVTVLPTGTETLVGATSVTMNVQWMSLRFKSVTGGYILI